MEINLKNYHEHTDVIQFNKNTGVIERYNSDLENYWELDEELTKAFKKAESEREFIRFLDEVGKEEKKKLTYYGDAVFCTEVGIKIETIR